MRLPTLLAAMLLLITGTAALAQDTPADPIQKELEALLAEHEHSELGYPEAYRAFLPRFEGFVKQHRGTEPEVRATLWLIQQTWWLREGNSMDKVNEAAMPLAEDLLKRHPDSPQLDLLVEYKYNFSKEQRDLLFNRLLEISHEPRVKAAAHFGLAQALPPRDADGAPNPHFVALTTEFANVKWRETTYGAIADACLNPISPADLAPGKPAPEIEGIDHNGKPMKLSDYRGKVVLLDFWGDW